MFRFKVRVQNLLVNTDLDSEISHCCIASVGHATLSQSVLDKQISSFNIIAFLSLIKFHCTHNPSVGKAMHTIFPEYQFFHMAQDW